MQVDAWYTHALSTRPGTTSLGTAIRHRLARAATESGAVHPMHMHQQQCSWTAEACTTPASRAPANKRWDSLHTLDSSPAENTVAGGQAQQHCTRLQSSSQDYGPMAKYFCAADPKHLSQPVSQVLRW